MVIELLIGSLLIIFILRVTTAPSWHQVRQLVIFIFLIILIIVEVTALLWMLMENGGCTTTPG